MKTLHLSIIIVIAITIMLTSTYVILTTPHSTGPIGAVSPQMNNITNVSTVVIPKDSEDSTSGKNYEPRYLVVVLEINNTVRWINQGEVMNSVVADNQNDPNFFDATNKQTYMNFQGNVNPPNFLRPGESFEYTFTKSGYFGYHGVPHPWQHGWVFVLPPSATSAVTTVTLNDSNVLGPCGVFALPCPLGPHIFTAQQFGSNIYIEKITINGVDNYAVVKPEGFCVYPPSYSHSCTNSDDLAILRLVGVDTSIPQRDVNISIKGLQSTYVVGKQIDFGIEVKGYGNCDVPSVLVITEGYIKWQSKMPVISCPPGMGEMDRNYTLQDLGGPFSLNQTGRYTVHVGYDFNSTEIQFNVTSSTGLPQSSHIIYTKNNNPFGIIPLVIYSPSAACLSPCGPYDFHLKINANSTAYLLGYNICDGDSCAKRNDLSILLPITDILRPDFAMIGLPENLKWKFGDTINIQLEVSSAPDNKTAILLDLGNSTIVH